MSHKMQIRPSAPKKISEYVTTILFSGQLAKFLFYPKLLSFYDQIAIITGKKRNYATKISYQLLLLLSIFFQIRAFNALPINAGWTRYLLI